MTDGSRQRSGVHVASFVAAGRPAAPIMLVPVAIIGIAGAWRALTPGMVRWDVAGDALLDSVRCSGPVAAGLTAWLTIRSARSGLGRLERPGRRSAAAGPLIGLGVAGSAALAGYVLTAGAVAAWLWAHGTITGSFQAQELAAGAAVLLAHVTAGFLVALLCSATCRPAHQGPARSWCAGLQPPPPMRSPVTRSPRMSSRLACQVRKPQRLLAERPAFQRFRPQRFRPPRPRPQRPRPQRFRPQRSRRLMPQRLRRARALTVHFVLGAGEEVRAAAIPAVVLTASWALAGWSDTGRGAGGGLWGLLVSPDVHHSPFTEWRPGLFLAAITWFSGLTAAAILASGLLLSHGRRYAIGLAAASVVAAVSLGQLRADAARPVTAVSAAVVCRSWPLQVCVNPAFAPALPQLESAFTVVAAQVSGTPAAVRSITQLPPGRNGSPGPGGYSFHLDDLGSGYELRAESDLVRQVAGALYRADLNRAHLSRATANRATANRATANRATANRATANRATANRATANRATANRATANRATANRATANRATANRATLYRATLNRPTLKRATLKPPHAQITVISNARSRPSDHAGQAAETTQLPGLTDATNSSAAE